MDPTTVDGFWFPLDFFVTEIILYIFPVDRGCSIPIMHSKFAVIYTCSTKQKQKRNYQTRRKKQAQHLHIQRHDTPKHSQLV